MVQAGKAKKIFDGRYEILSIVGRGARSVVYHARHVNNPSIEVALKVVVDKEGQPSIRDKLKKEALAMVSCRHQYVVRLDDFHTVENLSYFSMEYAPEGDLRKYVARIGGKLPADQAMPFFTQCAMALAQIHGCGVIHRDIKPDNILVLHDSEIRIADFGIAVLPGETASIQELESGIGTMDYMAPEVLEGREYTAASDVYALGVVFYEMLSGKHPFDNVPLIQQLEARKIENLAPISNFVQGLPAHLTDAVMRCMSYGTVDRFTSGKELLEFLKSRGKKGSSTPSAPQKQTAAPPSLPESSSQSAETEKQNAIGRGYTKKDISFKVGRFKLREKPSRVHTQDDAPPVATPGEMESTYESLLEAAPEIPLNTDDRIETASSTDSQLARELEPEFMDSPTPTENESRPDFSIGNPLTEESTDTGSEDFMGEIDGTEEPYNSPETRLESEVQPEESFTPADDGSETFQRQKTVFVDREQMETVSPRPFVPTPEPVKRRPLLLGIILTIVALFAYSAREDLLSIVSGLSSRKRSLDSGSKTIPSVTTPDFSFPELPSGMYVGTIDGLVPLKSIPLTIVSIPDQASLAIIIGIEGWTPRVVEWPATDENSDAENTPSIRVASNGIVLKMSGRNVDGDLIGYFINPISGERGDWKASPVREEESQ